MQRVDLSGKAGPHWLTGLAWATAQLIAVLLFLWLLVTVEFFWLASTHPIAADRWVLLAGCWVNTAISWVETGPVLLLLYLAAFSFSAVLSRFLLRGLVFLLVLVQLSLAAYFSTTSVPLGADIYGYSWSDIRETVRSAGGIPWEAIGVAVLVVAACAVWLYFATLWINRPRRRLALVWTAGGWCVIAGFSLFTGWSGVGAGGTEFTRNLALDKTAFFVRQSWEYWHRDEQETDIYADNYAGGDAVPGLRQKKYIGGDDYPFLEADSIPDVLSPFFLPDRRPPDIVIILVEGLGRAFTNEEAYLGNFTPFLDSLARKSLYWDNFLSAGGRTFAVLPSVLGSLPYAENGFLALGDSMPRTLTLNGILHTDGYHTGFYYGGDARFDNMAAFLHLTGIDKLEDIASFPAGYTTLPAQNGFSWGYGDAELFRWWLQSTPARETPQLSVLLTLSTHSPFRLNQPGVWRQRFEARMDELGFNEAQKQEHRLSRDQYASILYTDNALRNFMAAYARRPDFAHTVFLITGDHRMPEIPMRDKIDRFHVPLLIYSPLLRRTAVFHSVSTHLDIAPSLLAWLHNAYGLAIPALNAWVGDGLDTAAGFRNIHRYPLMQTKTDLVDFVGGNDHLNGGTVFRLHPDLAEDAIDDDSARAALQLDMDQYRRRNMRWLRSRRLWPDSLLWRFGR